MSDDQFSTHLDGADPLAPEVIDEQITARLANAAPAGRETHLTQGLATLNRLPPGADDSLARVRTRLRAAPFPTQTTMPTIEVNRPMNDLQTQPSHWPSSSPIRTPPRAPSPFRRTMQTVAAVIAAVLVVAGFVALVQQRTGGSAGHPIATNTTTATNTAQATTPSTSTVSLASAAQAAACAFQPSGSEPAFDLGNGLIVTPSLGGLAYPAFQLPEGTPLAPLKLSGDHSNSGQFLPALVNPNLRDSGLSLIVCNIGQQPVTIEGVKVSITSFNPYSGQLNSWYPCDGMYSGPNKITAGCGGGEATDEVVSATFAAHDGAGAVVKAVEKTASATYGTMPFTLPVRTYVRAAQKGASGIVLIKVQVIPPTTPGDYVFSLGLVTQNRATAFVPAVSASTPILLAPVAHKWDGQACQAPNMASQIPPETNPPTYYICPEP